MTQTTADSPITSERFKTGKTYAHYIESGIRNRELFDRNYEGTVPTPEQAARLKALAAKPGGPARMAVIGEDWCPDVYRGMPVAARIAEAMGIEMRVFERDQNKDLIQSYLNNGEFESIPVLVFFDADHRQLGHFIERPALANEEMHQVRSVLGPTRPEDIARELGHEPTEEEVADFRAKSREKYLEWQKGETWAGWRSATIDEVIELLS
jgi:hypothetical protein